MVDLSDKVSESEEMMSSQTSTPERGIQIKTCADCGTTKTPLWRGGPAGPKSLCNACGIRSRKKRRALLGLNKEEKKPKKSTTNISHIKSSSNSNNNNNNSSNRFGDLSLKRKLWSFGGDVGLQRPRSSSSSSSSSNSNSQRRKLGEEEQAAFLLMAMSCGSVYA